MPAVVSNLVVYIISFFALWVGSGFIISSVNKLSHRLHVPRFLVSFVVLGILTSTPEIAVGLTAVSSGNPGIFVGNLLGGIPVLFFLVIPLLAIFGRGITLSHSLSKTSILLALSAAIAPFFAVLDQKVSNLEGAVLIAFYAAVVFLIERSGGVDEHNKNLFKVKSYSFIDILKVLFGTAVVFFSSNVVVEKTLYFSEIFKIAPFYMSLIILSVGTNLPELTLGVKSIITNKKDIAFGDYLGSAAANGFLFGIFTLMSKDNILAVDSFTPMLILVAIGLTLFFFFSKSKHSIAPKEGFALLLIYTIFVAMEITQK